MKHKANVAHCKLILQHLPSAMQLRQTKNTFPQKKISQTTRSTRKFLVLFRGVLKLMVKKKRYNNLLRLHGWETGCVGCTAHVETLSAVQRGQRDGGWGKQLLKEESMFTAALHHQEAGGRQQTPWHHQYGYPQHELTVGWQLSLTLPCFCHSGHSPSVCCCRC